MTRKIVAALSVAFIFTRSGTAEAQTFRISVSTSQASLNKTTADGNASIKAYVPFEIKTVSASFNDALESFDVDNNDTWKAVDSPVDFSGLINVVSYNPEVAFNAGLDQYLGSLNTVFQYTPGKSGTPTPIQNATTAGTPPSVVSSTNINGKAVWVQSYSTSRPLPGGTELSIDTLPQGPNTFAGPIYPYEYNGSPFGDLPTNAANFWVIFQAYLVVPNFNKDTLTVYDGVQWGFQLTLNGAGAPGNDWGGNAPHVITTPSPIAGVPFLIGGLTCLRRRTIRLRFRHGSRKV